MSRPSHDYPAGANAPAYRHAFAVWVILFLTVLCVAFANFLALNLRGRL